MRVTLAVCWIAIASVVQAIEPARAPNQIVDVEFGEIRLPTGFEFEKRNGIDSVVGRIWRKGGPEIKFDIGQGAGNYAKHYRDNALWFKETTFKELKVQMTLTKDRLFCLTFPKYCMNFRCKTKTDEDLVEVLAVLLTFSERPELRDQK
jgi:hypothetical protein